MRRAALALLVAAPPAVRSLELEASYGREHLSGGRADWQALAAAAAWTRGDRARLELGLSGVEREAPESLPVLRSQRMRWQRGLLESLFANRQLLFHPRGGAPGWLAFPLLLLFEAVGPAVELAGWATMAAAFLLRSITWQAFGAFGLAALGLGMLLSASALLLEEMSLHIYDRPRQLAALLAAMAVENLGYRQLTAWWRLQALARWLVRRPGRWGAMRRTATWEAGRRP